MPKRNTPNYGALNSPVHFRRYDLLKSGKDIKEIAELERVGEGAIRRSIEAVKLYTTRNTHDNMNQGLISVIMELKNDIRDALREALGATIEIKDGDKTVHEPDHNTQLKAVAEVRQIAQVVQPRTGPTTNIGIGINNQPTRVASGGYVGMEDRLREIRQQRQQQPLLEAKTVAVAELEQPGGEFATEDEGDEDE